MLILIAAALLLADPSPRLATVHTAYVVAADPLADDQPVAPCFADRLAKDLPLVLAETREAADVVLVVSAHLPGAAMSCDLARA